MVKTAVLVSGGGTSLQSLIDASMFGEMPACELTAVISTKPDAYALRRAVMAGISTYVVERDIFPSATVFGFALLDKLRDLDIELAVLAGYDCELTQPIKKHYAGRIIDSYPSLMPAFTGEEISADDACLLALQAGAKLTGATAYFVAEKPGAGPIILQKAVAVRDDDTPTTLRRRILEEGENTILPRAVALFCEGKLILHSGRVRIDEPLPSPSEEKVTT